MKTRKLFLGCVLACASIFSFGQAKDCDNFTARIEVVEEAAVPVLKIQIDESGDFRIRLIDMDGKIREIKQGSHRDIIRGKYDIIIIDEANKKRCPIIKRIEV
jgi:hypothetical protein